MVLTLETAGELVPGAQLKEEKGEFMDTTRIRILRPFYYQGVIIEKGKEIEVGRVFAIDMVSANKAEVVMPGTTPPINAPPEEKIEVKDTKKSKKEEK